MLGLVLLFVVLFPVEENLNAHSKQLVVEACCAGPGDGVVGVVSHGGASEC